ncbi:MAG: YciI family protein [Gemmatimonadota bacterium]
MKYMLLLYEDEANWDGVEMTPEVMEPWMKYSQRVQEAGVYISGAGLQPTTAATTVRVRGGKVLTTDGPFAETKEQLGGYYLLECSDLDEALRWAAEIPIAPVGSVEVRPLLDV